MKRLSYEAEENEARLNHLALLHVSEREIVVSVTKAWLQLDGLEIKLNRAREIAELLLHKRMNPSQVEVASRQLKP